MLTHLQRLESESIHLFREVVAECERPVFLYSVGKDSSVMLHLALKAFHPAPPPFPFLHVASGWDFRDVLTHRERVVKRYGLELIVAHNDEAEARGTNPFDTPTPEYTRLMLTAPLKAALTHHRFDAAFGGGRRDEERSRAKERMLSLRNSEHLWEPRRQRPELWRLFNARHQTGESLRAFPLSNWTELDIWRYIAQENIDVVPLYFAADRPVVSRHGMQVIVDDDRMRIGPDDRPALRQVRMRTLGCYPLSGCVESSAFSVSQIIDEIGHAQRSEREGRAVDHDQTASMERKKQEGYF